MEKAYLIDLILLKKFQRISDWVQDHLGHNNFAIAKFLRAAMAVALLLREVISFRKGMDGTEIIIVACSAAIIIKMKFIAHNAEQVLKTKNELMNPVVNQYAVARIIIQFVALAAFGYLLVYLYYIVNQPFMIVDKWYDEWKELFWNFFGVLIFPVAYFSSCTPRPYKTSKNRKHIERSKLTQTVASVLIK